MRGMLSIVVPCFNEQDLIVSLCEAVMSVAQPLATELELLLVDDGSVDDTYALAAGLASRDGRVRVLRLSRNFGKEAALTVGLQAARGDAVILMDADLQHPPALIPQLLAAYERGFDQVVARRDRQGDPLLRRWAAHFYYRIVGRLIDVQIQDGVGDFRLLSRPVVDALLRLPESNRFSKGLFSWVGFEVAYVDFHNVARGTGRSRWSTRKLIDYGVDGVVAFNARPLRIGIWSGLAAVALAVAYVLWLLVRYLQDGTDLPGYLTTVAVIVGLGGVQLICLGIIGEYVGRIYREVKARPHAIVREELNKPQC